MTYLLFTLNVHNDNLEFIRPNWHFKLVGSLSRFEIKCLRWPSTKQPN